jgi:hypothetical protein
MDRFMEDADPTKKALSQNLQSDIRKCRERIQVLEAGDVSQGRLLKIWN